MYLFLDTETTGTPLNFNAPASDVANWPRLVQIAWLITDPEGQELLSQACIIRPEGFKIPPSATRIHGIDTETARRVGIEIGQVLTTFAQALERARIVVGHNVQFDERVVGAEFFRAGREKNPIKAMTLFCTMRSSTDFCRIAGGPRGYKWPTLDQLHRTLFGVGLDSAHNAVTDVRACAKCFFELKSRGIISAGEVLAKKM